MAFATITVIYITTTLRKIYRPTGRTPVYFCNMLIFPGMKIRCNPSLSDLILFPKKY